MFKRTQKSVVKTSVNVTFPRIQLLWALGSLSALHQRDFSETLLAHAFPGEGTEALLIQVARALGFDTKAVAVTAADLARLPLPLLVALKPADSQANPSEVQLAIITAAAPDQLVVFAAGTNTPQNFSAAQLAEVFAGTAWLLAPNIEAPQDADSQMDSQAGTASTPAGTTRRFNFAWFRPELLRHRKVWRDVLFASLALQIVALSTPLFTQAIIDKVVVHRTETTLMAIGAVMVIFLLFNAILGWGRQYLVLHTGNRVDAVLGAAVWDHLLKLPTSYFQQRLTGVVAARLHAVENIREFVSGAAISLILDLPFLVICLGIMLWYSVTLTAICVGLLLIIGVASLVMAPIFQRQLNDQFLLGARNQAFVTEHIAGFETIKTLQMEPQLRQRYSGYLSTFLARETLQNLPHPANATRA